MVRNIRIQTFVVPEKFDLTMEELFQYAPAFPEFTKIIDSKKTLDNKPDGRYIYGEKNQRKSFCIRFAILYLVNRAKELGYKKTKSPEVQNE